MAKKNKTNKKSGASVSTKAKADAAVEVIANPRLVATIQSYDSALSQARSLLVDIAEITLEEQLSRAEVVASIMEARDCTKQSAESQYSRMKKIIENPEVLEQLRNGEIDLKTAREKTTKKQANPSSEKQQENLEKRFSKALTQIVACSKEAGYDLATVVNAVKSALRKGGVK